MKLQPITIEGHRFTIMVDDIGDAYRAHTSYTMPDGQTITWHDDDDTERHALNAAIAHIVLFVSLIRDAESTYPAALLAMQRSAQP